MKRLAIEVGDNAFLPEAYAYRDFFIGKDIDCLLVRKGEVDLSGFDGVILFHGFHPFWRRYAPFVIGEYHSLSVGRYGRLKDFLKRIFNVRADGYVFLNEKVQSKMFFKPSPCTFLRGMGVRQIRDELLEQEKEFDVVYCGAERDGVKEAIEKLAFIGFSVAVVGFDWPGRQSNIMSFGKIGHEKAYEVLSKARFGLNYTPDVHPLNIQDSTKILEYCSAGIGVITNKYWWVNEFERDRGARFLDIDDVVAREDVLGFDYHTPSVVDLEWGRVIQASGFVDFVIEKI